MPCASLPQQFHPHCIHRILRLFVIFKQKPAALQEKTASPSPHRLSMLNVSHSYLMCHRSPLNMMEDLVITFWSVFTTISLISLKKQQRDNSWMQDSAFQVKKLTKMFNLQQCTRLVLAILILPKSFRPQWSLYQHASAGKGAFLRHALVVLDLCPHMCSSCQCAFRQQIGLVSFKQRQRRWAPNWDSGPNLLLGRNCILAHKDVSWNGRHNRVIFPKIHLPAQASVSSTKRVLSPIALEGNV